MVLFICLIAAIVILILAQILSTHSRNIEELMGRTNRLEVQMYKLKNQQKD